MKKLCLIFLSLYSLTLNAQFNRGNYVYEVIGVEVFSEPNYGGTRVNFTSVGDQRAPFVIRSMRVPNGYIVFNYSRLIGDIPVISENSYLYNNILILSTPKSRQEVEITLLQINSNIHNGDCQRFYGNVSFNIIFEYPDGRSLSILEYLPTINWRRGPVRNIPNYSDADVRNIENKQTIIKVDESLLSQCILDIQTNLGSAHKSCDLCTDFTWEAKMPRTRTERLNLATALSQGIVIAGPYRTSDNRHDIRVKFQVRRL